MSSLLFSSLFASIAALSVAFFPFLPPLVPFSLFAITAIFLSVIYRRHLLIIVIVGLSYGVYYGHYLTTQQLPHSLDGKTLSIDGLVVNLPDASDESIKFNIIVQSVGEIEGVDESIDLSVLVDKKIKISYSKQYAYSPSLNIEQITPGKTIQLRLKLRRPRGFVNPVGFDYQHYLLQQKISATAYVKKSSKNKIIESHNVVFSADLLRYIIRQKVKNIQQEAMISTADTDADHNSIGPLLALMTGDKSLMNDQQWTLFKNTGTIHLMVISGLHIGLAALLGFYIGLFLSRIVQIIVVKNRVVLYLPALFSIFFAASYSLLSGFGLPSQRALVMVVLFNMALLLGRQINSWALLVVALCAVTLLDPLSARSQGFWLSFLAVAFLFLAFLGYSKKPIEKKIINKVYHLLIPWLKSQWILLLGLSIPSILLLGGLSSSGFISNLIAIPVVSFIVVPLVLLTLLSLFISVNLAEPIFLLTIKTIEYLLWLLEKIDDYFPGFYQYSQGEISVITALCAAIGVFYLLLPRGFNNRFIGAVCFLPILLPSQQAPILRATFLDVGQGMAAVIETKKHTLVYDTGRHFSDSFDVGESIVGPYLLSLGHRNIDVLLLSHGDSDHAGGAKGLQKIIRPLAVVSGEPSKTGGTQCVSGQSWQWDGVVFDVLWPSSEYMKSVNQGSIPYKSNNLSCVIKITQGSESILLAGDIDKVIESKILKELGHIDIVLAPHHGSRSSSSLKFIQTTRPEYVVFSAGYKNGYGHPHPKVVDRYQNHKTLTLNTATEGAIRFTLNDQQLWDLERWRIDYSRYWY